MSERRVVSDTGPLISLEKLPNGFGFIRRLYDVVLVPEAVLEEVSAGQFASGAAYLAHYRIADLVEVRSVSAAPTLPAVERLDEGERQGIALALELGLPLLIEETIGRAVAKALGLGVSGIAGQVLKALRLGVVELSEAEALTRRLLAAGRIDRKLYGALLAAMRSG